jgi:hypothetical protein
MASCGLTPGRRAQAGPALGIARRPPGKTRRMGPESTSPRHRGGASGRPALPAARGPLTQHVLDHLSGPPHHLPPAPSLDGDVDVLSDDDAQLALYCCYELHYQSFDGVDDGWEWETSLLAFRGQLERAFEHRLAEELGPAAGGGDMEQRLAEVIERTDGPSLSSYMLEQGTIEQMREFAVHRSAYQLKEADPHTWAIPRLHGGPKAALVEIQFDEYGRGVEAEMHSTLFVDTMEALGLDTGYGAYLDLLPGTTLATTNLISLFGLRRRWRGARVGHLAVFEATSVGPMGRYAAAMRRLLPGSAGDRFYAVHVEADSHHQVVAWKQLAAGLVAGEPALADDVVFGARALMLVEDQFARHLLGAWSAGRSSLLHGSTIGRHGD